MHWEYATDALALLSVFVGILGDTHDKKVTGIRGIRPLGAAVLVIGTASLVFSVLKTIDSAADAKELSDNVKGLQTKLDAVNHQNSYLSGQINALSGVIDRGNRASLKIRDEQQAESARSMRVALVKTLCFAQFPYRIFNSGGSNGNLLDLADPAFIDRLRKYDLNSLAGKEADLYVTGSAGIPVYRTVSKIGEAYGNRFDEQMRVSAPYLPPDINESLNDYRFRNRRFTDAAVLEELHKLSENSDFPLLFDQSAASDYREMLARATLLDQRLSALSDRESKSRFGFDCRF